MPLPLAGKTALITGAARGIGRAVAHKLAAAGCDVIACHVDSPKVVVETAEARGVMSCGHNADPASLAPRGFITGAELKWGTVYTQYAKLIAAGAPLDFPVPCTPLGATRRPRSAMIPRAGA